MVFYQNYIKKTKLLNASKQKKNLPNFVTETREKHLPKTNQNKKQSRTWHHHDIKRIHQL